MIKKCCVSVTFKRKENSLKEVGIGIGDDTSQLDVIIDSSGKVVDGPIWDFKPYVYEGLIWFELQQ